jgi:hypothetical protein
MIRLRGVNDTIDEKGKGMVRNNVKVKEKVEAQDKNCLAVEAS